ncbi:MAG: tRNA (adenosine(37)-N6)-threonylcarbamoyltransferase complex dimerization subunit type 1 TsaB [Flavobacteriales bacterium]|nr:tRNA (adenosine(37)-N6)-threonylcarbamoyltransferase complex dimerization subunit type 1 TsaB [Flavobacteriales bacterium]
MAKIICLETATVNCSVAVFDNEKLLSFSQSNTGDFSHSEKLHIFIQQTLKEAGMEPKDLDCVAVSKGPGSYTGLRIGVSSAKGLAYALGIPVVTVDTLKIIAMVGQKTTEADLYVPMIDARRMEVYTAVYDRDMRMIEPVSAKVIDDDTFSFLPKDKKICFCGDGMGKCKNLIDIPQAIFTADVYPCAQAMGGEALRLFCEKKWEDVAYFEPYYLKDFVSTAQINKKK